MREQCSDCGKLLLSPSGPIKADILLLAGFPSYYEVKEGKLWSGPAGDILKNELRRVGIRYERCRATNLWQHAKDIKSCDIAGHWQRTLGEIVGRKAVLLMGAEVAGAFLDYAISDITGLLVTPERFPQSVKVAVAMVNPSVAQHDKLGEVRFAIERFGREVRKIR